MYRTSESSDSGPAAQCILSSRFRCPDFIDNFLVNTNLSAESGYFRLDSDAICYGQCASVAPAKHMTEPLPTITHRLNRNGLPIELLYDPAQVVDNLRCERYSSSTAGYRTLSPDSPVRSAYYKLRPLMPVGVRKHFQKWYLRDWDKAAFPAWPVDRTVENIFEKLLLVSMKAHKIAELPFIWFWPAGAKTCAMLTHDVETSTGVNFCEQLMDLNDSFSVKSSFQIVPEKRYAIPTALLQNIRKRGYEINIHDLNHDGHLFSNRQEFLGRAEKINGYAKQFGALGFRSAVLYRNVDWYDALDFTYDMSLPNVAHLDPQRGGCCTVFPFFIGKIVELPLTTTQDYSLFNILNDYSIRLWQQQVSLIREKHGLISFVVHPDYIIAKAARRVYADLLSFLSELRSEGETWIALPGEVAAWWRLRSEMKLVKSGGSWHIEGNSKEKARIAYARVVNDSLIYEVDSM
jgi:hypothetical protein